MAALAADDLKFPSVVNCRIFVIIGVKSSMASTVQHKCPPTQNTLYDVAQLLRTLGWGLALLFHDHTSGMTKAPPERIRQGLSQIVCHGLAQCLGKEFHPSRGKVLIAFTKG